MRPTQDFETKRLPAERDAVAPDGSDVRVLLSLPGVSMAHYELAAGQTSLAVTNQTVEEIWFFLGGQGQMWRWTEEREEIVDVEADICLTIPQGTRFQFRALGDRPLTAVGITIPSWPGQHEARVVDGPWTPTVSQP